MTGASETGTWASRPRVTYTAQHCQLVRMGLEPGGEVGASRHAPTGRPTTNGSAVGRRSRQPFTLWRGTLHNAAWSTTAVPLKLLIPLVRRDVRVVEGARLESVCRGNSTVGSNPTLSAITRQTS